MHIAICDDSTADMERLKKCFVRLIEYSVTYDSYSSAEKLLTAISCDATHYDLFLLDIEMPKINGMSLARKIRKTDAKALLVFLTSYNHFMAEAFEVITFDYILKPIDDAKLKRVLDKAMNYLNITNRNFSFQYQRNRYSLRYDDILYFEKKGRQAIIASISDDYKTNMTLTEIWSQLDERAFATIHGSYIVNMKHIKSLSPGSLKLTDGTELSVSRGRRKEMNAKYYDYLRGGM